jgi:hypothetical protein
LQQKLAESSNPCSTQWSEKHVADFSIAVIRRASRCVTDFRARVSHVVIKNKRSFVPLRISLLVLPQSAQPRKLSGEKN